MILAFSGITVSDAGEGTREMIDLLSLNEKFWATAHHQSVDHVKLG